MFRILFCAGLIISLGACSIRPTTPSNSASTPAAPSNTTANAESDAALLPAPNPLPSFHLADPQAPELVDKELSIIPTEVNSNVEKWIIYFQGKGRPHMERYLARSTRYEKMMKKVLRENGLPEDLFYIALIESGFVSNAFSHASAVGYWQFIRGTGKRYGLQINRLVDERRDPILATQAAADYFKGLYSGFGSWYLAMASYNVGENRVKREVMEHQTRDFWELARKNRFPKETINYIPKFIAAKLIGKNPEKYGFEDIDYLPPLEFDSVTLTNAVNMRVLADKLNVNYEDFKALNPKFKGEIAPMDSTNKLSLRIPVGQAEQAIAAAVDAKPDKVDYVADQKDQQAYRIRRGDSLHTIARKFKTSVAYLRDLNDLPKGKRLKVGSTVYAPDRTPAKERKTKVSQKERESRPTENVSPKFYVVQSGDSLTSIADKYNTSIDELVKANNLARNKMIKAGAKLKLPKVDAANTESESESKKDDSPKQSGGLRNAKPVVHIVKRGENLEKIANKYNVEIEDILKRNKIRKAGNIFAGARLVIPK